MYIRYILPLLVLAIAAAAWFGFAEGTSSDASANADAAASQAMPVKTVTIKTEPIQLWKPFSGNVVAVDYAEIRPQVEGRITEILFEDGQYVEQGDVLMVITPALIRQRLNRLKPPSPPLKQRQS